MIITHLKLSALALAMCMVGVAASAASTAHSKGLFEQALLTPKTSSRSTFSSSDDEVTALAKVYVINQELPIFLREVARRNGYQIALPNDLRGVLKNRTFPIDIKKILPVIAEQFDFKWHFESRKIHISPGERITTRVLDLGRMHIDQLHTAMLRAEIKSGAYDVVHLADSNAVRVDGSLVFIESLEALIQSHPDQGMREGVSTEENQYENAGD